jgi:hypothetical protein
VQHVVEQKQRVLDGRFVGRHRSLPAPSVRR